MNTNRREFGQKTLATSAVLGLLGSTQPAWAELADIPIIDTHQHLWDLVQFSPPWLEGADPKIAAKHDMQDYRTETAGLNVVKAIYMEVDVAPEHQITEADYVLALIANKQTPTVAAVISGRPNSENFARYIRRYKDSPAIKGVRQVLHVPTASKGLCLQPQFIESVRLLGKLGMSFDLCMRPTELTDGVALAEKCPETQLIVDHCGNADPKAWMSTNRRRSEPTHTIDQWKSGLEKLAQRPNVVCKISGIVARAPAGWLPEDLAPSINFCLDQFGPNRVVFGGDWPVCKLGASIAQWVTALRQIIQSRPLTDQRKLLHDNAIALYRLT